jgi:hypothetical protein
MRPLHGFIGPRIRRRAGQALVPHKPRFAVVLHVTVSQRPWDKTFRKKYRSYVIGTHYLVTQRSSFLQKNYDQVFDKRQQKN